MDRNTQSLDNVGRDGKREFFQHADSDAFSERMSMLDGEHSDKQEDLDYFVSQPNDESVSEDEVQTAGPARNEAHDKKRAYERGASDQNSSFDESHYFKLRANKLA